MKAVIFDCFQVLYLNRGQLFFESHVPQYSHLKPRLQELSRQADAGYLTQHELAAQTAELTGLDTAFVAEHISGKFIRNDELLNFAQDLRPQVRIGLLSNISQGGIEKYFSKEERAALFDVTVLSSDVGMLKPFPEIYQLASERIGVPPSGCIFVDDSEDNCAGADAAGMRPVRYISNRQAIADIRQLLAE